MKTAEEKAKEYASKECPIIISGSMQTLTFDEWRELAERDYLAGYKEAMRWRKPNEELPKYGVTVQVKRFNAHDNILEYVHDEYLGKNKWRKCTSMYIYIIGWRPIE